MIIPKRFKIISSILKIPYPVINCKNSFKIVINKNVNKNFFKLNFLSNKYGTNNEYGTNKNKSIIT